MQPGGAGRAQSQRSVKHARPPTRATGAWIAGAAGPEVYPMSHTRNTKINKIHEAWATLHGYRTKAQAPSNQLDKGPGLGYHRITEDSKKRAPKRSPPGPLSPSPARPTHKRWLEKSGRSCERSSGHKGLQGLQPKAASNKLQAASNKRQAASSKRQAPSAKHQAKKYYRKFVGPRSMNQQP